MALLAVPNVSEGRDAATIAAIGEAFELQILDVHSDPDHNRTVFTLAGDDLAEGLARGAREAIGRIDLNRHTGIHPHVGALDVAPIVYTTEADRGAACAQALVAADLIARDNGVPVFLYGALAGGRTRAELRRGGAMRLAERVSNGELRPDYGPARLHPTAGAVLVAARPPLVAFNLVLAPPATLVQAKTVARAIRRELPTVKALGLQLSGAVQLSFNLEDPLGTPLAELVAAVRRRVPVARAELVGLSPAAAWEGFPEDLPVPGFDPEWHVLENALARASYSDAMAQTKRKRKSKHRGTAAGTVTARGRTGRKLTDDERKAATKRPGAKGGTPERRPPRHEKPPTWKGSLQRAAVVTVVFVVILLLLKSKPAGIIAILPVVLVIYTAIGYYTDRFMHQRWLRKQGR